MIKRLNFSFPSAARVWLTIITVFVCGITHAQTVIKVLDSGPCIGSTYDFEFDLSSCNNCTPIGWTITGNYTIDSESPTSLSVHWNAAGSFQVIGRFTAPGFSSLTSSPYNVTIGAPPSPSISGTTQACTGSTNNVYSSSGMSNYSWSVIGGTITSGQNTSSVNVTWTSAGSRYVSVSGSSGSCSGGTSLNVTVAAPPGVVGSPTGGSVCGPGAATISASVGSGGHDVRWYTALTGGSHVASGTSYTPSVSSTTTYYAGTINISSLCESSRTPVTLTVNTIPSSPSGTGATRCDAGTLTLNATAGANGNTVRWYNALTGGSPLATSLTYTTASISSTTTYYISTFNSTTLCESTSARVPVVATIGVPSAPTPTPASRCGTGTVTLTAAAGSGGSQVRWYAALTGGSALTTGTSYTTPGISTTTTYYITTYNPTTLCESTPRTAIAATINAIPSAPTATNGSRCGTGTVALSGTPGASGNSLRWYAALTGGSPLATATSYTTPSIATTTTYYISSYNNTSSCESTAARVAVTATVNAIPATPTTTNQSLCGSGSATLSATPGANGTIIRWYNASTGVTLLATNNTYTTPTISATTTYYASSYNATTTCEGTRSPVTVTVNTIPSAPTGTGANRCDAGTLTLSATTGANGNTVRWYSALTGGTPLAAGLTFTTPSISATTTYYISSYHSTTLCESTAARIPVVATIGTLAAPVPTPASRCGTGTVALTASAGSGGTQVRWYAAATGGTVLTTATSYTTPSISTTTTYYITSYNPTSLCESTPRTAIVATVNAIPASPTGTNTSRCGTGTVTLTGTPGTNANSLRWYAALTGGSPLTTATSYTTPSLSVTTTYYISSYNTTTGCESSTARVPVTATVNVVPAVAITTNQSLCGSGTATLHATPGTNGTVIRWYNASSGGTLLATNNSFTTPSVSATTIYYASSFNATTTCESARTAVTVTVNAIPSVPVVPVVSRCDAGTVTLTATVGANGNNVRWYKAASGGMPLSTSLSFTTPFLTANATYYAASYHTTTGCEGSRIPVTITLNTSPGEATVTGNSRTTPGTFTLTASGGAGGSVYKWYSASGTLLTTGTSYTTPSFQVTTPNHLYVTIVDASGCIGLQTWVTLNLNQKSFADNHIRTNVIQVPGVVNISDIDALPLTSRQETIEYFDDFGRPLQTVITQGSPQRKDVVQPFRYDRFGREARKYLPYVSGESTGRYKQNALGTPWYTSTSDHYMFYTNGTADKIQDDNRALSETYFELSPLNRPSKQYGAGNSWSTSGDNKYIEMQYLLNVYNTGSPSHEKIIAWKLNVNGMPLRSSAVATYVETGGYYSSNQLSVTTTRDEETNEVRTYTNKEGKVILKKIYVKGSKTNLTDTLNWALTYYIYDDHGNLRYILPPELNKKIHRNDTHNPSQADLNNWAFQYQYDNRNRMTIKKIPGAEPVYMVYDNRDRLVLTQDGNQRAGSPGTVKYWTFTKYDELNRPILTGVKDTTTAALLTQADMQNAVDTYYAAMVSKPWRKYGEVYKGNQANTVHGYSNVAYPVVTSGTVLDPQRYLTVTYYDNYAFSSSWSTEYAYQSIDFPQMPAAANTGPAGQVTGTKNKVLDGGLTGGSTWLKAVNYYDEKYRLIQAKSENYKGGVDRTSSVMDFTGKVMKSKHSHATQNVTWKDQIGTLVEGNQLKRNSASTAGAASVEQLAAGQNGWLEFTVSEINTVRTIGFNDANPDVAETNINYAFKLNSNVLTVVENNTTKKTVAGNLVPGEVLRIERSGTAVTYYRNGTPITLDVASTASSTLLMVDVSLGTNGASLVGIRTSFSATSKAITRTSDYDHTGRLLRTFHQVDNGPVILLNKIEYNELGELVDKKLHSTVASGADANQSVDYRYNIRGWLTSINNSALNTDASNDESTDYFGMNFYYNTQHPDIGNTKAFNGNISGVTWSNYPTAGPVTEKAYTYSYDALSRLSGSVYKEKTSSWSAFSNSGFAETGLQYDMNGNISSLTRNDKRGSGTMDMLTYSYGTNSTRGNKLMRVTDDGDDYAGFMDGNPGTSDDYKYDDNGNLIYDLSKGIGTSLSDGTNRITYNFMNLPETVTKSGNTIRYVYDATGSKLAQVVNYGGQTKQTDYVGEFTYENGALQFITHEEGRISMASTKLVFIYNGETATGLTSAGTSLSLVTENGNQKYVKATVSNTTGRPGIFPFGSAVPVNGGDRYKLRLKGYRTGNNVANLQVKVNGTDLVWPGAALPKDWSAESWIEQIFTIPGSSSALLEIGVGWATVTSGESVYVNEIELTRLDITSPEYQYYLKDNLDNIRVTFTSKQETECAMATLEPASQSDEQGKFLRYENARKVRSAWFDHTNGAVLGYAQRLNGQGNEVYGLARSLSVMPGDVINMEVFAKYIDSNTTNWTLALNTLLGQIVGGTTPGGTVVDGGNYSSSTSSFPFPIDAASAHATTTGTGPKAYITWLVYDRNFNFLLNQSGFDRMTTDGREYGQDGPHERLFGQITVKQAGYVYVYLSNEEGVNPYEVYFDDFKVDHIKSQVIQSDDYYPYGLTFNSYLRENTTPQDFKYNAKEEQAELGLGWYDFGARMYMPELGRFFKQDRFAEKLAAMSPYQYGANNPISFMDINGDSLWIAFGEHNEHKVLYQNGKLLNKDGSRYEGEGVKVTKKGNIRIKDAFLQSVVTELGDVSKAEAKMKTDVVSTLQSSNNNFTIAKGVEHFDPGTFEQPYLFANQATHHMKTETGLSMLMNWTKEKHGYDLLPADKVGSGGIIYWGGHPNKGVGLGHEMFHGYDANTGKLIIDPTKDARTSINKTNIGEIRASTFENGIRRFNHFPLRETYDGGHRLIDKKGKPIAMPPAQVNK